MACLRLTRLSQNANVALVLHGAVLLRPQLLLLVVSTNMRRRETVIAVVRKLKRYLAEALLLLEMLLKLAALNGTLVCLEIESIDLG